MMPAQNNAKGILFILFGMAFFSIQDALIKMERRGTVLGKVDLGLIYQTGLVFPGPKPVLDSFKMKTKLGKVKVQVLTKENNIYYEEGAIRFAIDINYEIL